MRSSAEAESLLSEMSRGSISAFERFYETYSPFVLHIALKLAANRMDAEDICHDVLLDVWKRAASYDSARGSVEAWLAVKTRNFCLDAIRRKKRWEEKAPLLTNSWEAAGAAAEDAALAELGWAHLRAALEQIPLSQRQAVYGAYVEDLTHTELAERMHRPLGTIKSFVRYGLKHLRKQLAAAGWTSLSGGERHDDSSS